MADKIRGEPRACRDAGIKAFIIDCEALRQPFFQNRVKRLIVYQCPVRAGGFRLHDREYVRIERLDGSGGIAMIDFDCAVGNCIDAVAAGAGNRGLSQAEYVIDDGDAADRLGIAVFNQDACGSGNFGRAAGQDAHGIECGRERHRTRYRH